MVKIKNQVGSPFDIQTKNGPAVLPAFGTLEADFDYGYLELLLACGSVVLAEEFTAEPVIRVPNPQEPMVKVESIDTIEDSVTQPKRGRARKETGSGN